MVTRSAILLSLLLAGCGGAEVSPPSIQAEISLPPCAVYMPNQPDPYPPIPCVPRDVDEGFFSPGDDVIVCSPDHPELMAISYEQQGTVQLSDGRWYLASDLIQDGPPYSCDGERRPEEI